MAEFIQSSLEELLAGSSASDDFLSLSTSSCLSPQKMKRPRTTSMVLADEPNRKTTIVPLSSSSLDGEYLEIPESIYPRVENVIASCQLKTELDLKKIAFRVKNAEYNPRKVNAVVIRLRNPKATCLLYQGGKVMVTGSKSEGDALKVAKKAAKLAVLCGHPTAECNDFKIENMVASTDVNFPVRLEGVAQEHRATCSYEPELFPGLVFRMFDPKLSILVFVSGKVVLTGGRSKQEIFEAFRNIFPLLHKYRK